VVCDIENRIIAIRLCVKAVVSVGEERRGEEREVDPYRFADDALWRVSSTPWSL